MGVPALTSRATSWPLVATSALAMVALIPYSLVLRGWLPRR